MKDNEVTRQRENDGELAKGRDGRSPARMRKVKKMATVSSWECFD